jgi:hypothetical protein
MTVNELIEELQNLDDFGDREVCVGIVTGGKITRATISEITYAMTESEEDEDTEEEDYEGEERVWITVKDDRDNFYKVPSDIR